MIPETSTTTTEWLFWAWVAIGLIWVWIGWIIIHTWYLRKQLAYLLANPGGYSARIVADTISPAGARITTMEWTYWLPIHAEVMTYRMASRNANSNRAIPAMTVWKQVLFDPAGPIRYGRTARGMTDKVELDGRSGWWAKWLYMNARWPMLLVTLLLIKCIKGHKQWVNRLLMPWQWITICITACPPSWENIFRQRVHPAAQPEFRHIATLAKVAYMKSKPIEGRYHLPYVTPNTYAQMNEMANVNPEAYWYTAMHISAARCARTSYGKWSDGENVEKDTALYRRLVSEEPPHSSPQEHPAEATDDPTYRSGPLYGWRSLREMEDKYWRDFFPASETKA